MEIIEGIDRNAMGRKGDFLVIYAPNSDVFKDNPNVKQHIFRSMKSVTNFASKILDAGETKKVFVYKFDSRHKHAVIWKDIGEFNIKIDTDK
jgi:hypothetical protein